jgi:hypothetical protein
MVCREYRMPWRTDKRSFSFLWGVPFEAHASNIHVALRQKAIVIEVLDGIIEVADGFDSVRVSAPMSVAVSLPEFAITPIFMPSNGLKMLVHVIGTLPLRSMLKQHSVFKRLLVEAADSTPGIYTLGHHHLENSRQFAALGKNDMGEALVLHNLLRDSFLRFLGSIPRSLDKPESKRKRPSFGIKQHGSNKTASNPFTASPISQGEPPHPSR